MACGSQRHTSTTARFQPLKLYSTASFGQRIGPGIFFMERLPETRQSMITTSWVGSLNLFLHLAASMFTTRHFPAMEITAILLAIFLQRLRGKLSLNI